MKRSQRSLEAFNSAKMVEKETYMLMHNTFWEPDAANLANIKRTHKINDVRLGMSEFTHGCLTSALMGPNSGI